MSSVPHEAWHVVSPPVGDGMSFLSFSASHGMSSLFPLSMACRLFSCQHGRSSLVPLSMTSCLSLLPSIIYIFDDKNIKIAEMYPTAAGCQPKVRTNSGKFNRSIFNPNFFFFLLKLEPSKLEGIRTNLNNFDRRTKSSCFVKMESFEPPI